jgi:hypothetical protein
LFCPLPGPCPYAGGQPKRSVSLTALEIHKRQRIKGIKSNQRGQINQRIKVKGVKPSKGSNHTFAQFIPTAGVLSLFHWLKVAGFQRDKDQF